METQSVSIQSPRPLHLSDAICDVYRNISSIPSLLNRRERPYDPIPILLHVGGLCSSTALFLLQRRTTDILTTINIVVKPTTISTQGATTQIATTYSTSTVWQPSAPIPTYTSFTDSGTYTIPAKTITLNSTVTVPAPTTTSLTQGTNTYGGVTTAVTASTTFTCAYASISSASSTTSTVLTSTVYTCPSAGTYTVAPSTTACSYDSVFVYPVATSYDPGTYIQAETTIIVVETDSIYYCPWAKPTSSPNGASSSSAVSSPSLCQAHSLSTSAATDPSQPAPSSPPAPHVLKSAATYSGGSDGLTSAPSSPVSSASTSPQPVSSSAPSSAASSVPAAQSYTPASSGGSGNAAIEPNGNLWAMTYSPYTSTGACKDASAVAVDIATIKSKGFTTVRIYSTDCSGLQNVGAAARANGMKLIIGVFISPSGISGAQPQVTDIISWAQWDLVSLVVVGNEALYNGHCDASSLATFISSSKKSFAAAGYTGPVTTTDILAAMQEHGPTLCPSIDVLAGNLHPFFDNTATSSTAGPVLQAEMAALAKVCDGKPVYVMETGWPHAGQADGSANATPSDQKTAIKSIQDTVGAEVVFFAFEDDLWKDPGYLNVEQSWGCVNLF